VSKTWLWDQFANRNSDDSVTYYLEAGEHTLVIKQREDGAKIEKVPVTGDMQYVPEQQLAEYSQFSIKKAAFLF
jgi:hypothetical protein